MTFSVGTVTDDGVEIECDGQVSVVSTELIQRVADAKATLIRHKKKSSTSAVIVNEAAKRLKIDEEKARAEAEANGVEFKFNHELKMELAVYARFVLGLRLAEIPRAVQLLDTWHSRKFHAMIKTCNKAGPRHSQVSVSARR